MDDAPITDAAEPPCVEEGSPMDEYELAPGVFGYAIESGGAVYIPAIRATREGSGAVGKFLDALTSRCRIPSVVSERLRGMLVRRRWKATEEYDPRFGESVEVYIHPNVAAWHR